MNIRRLGATAVAVLALAACSSTASLPTTTRPVPTSRPGTSTAPTTTTTTSPTTTTVSRVARENLVRWVALAQKGLRQPFEAMYSSSYGFDFEFWSEPAPSSNESDFVGDQTAFVYERTAGSTTFRLIQKRVAVSPPGVMPPRHLGDFECLRESARSRWKCTGPVSPGSIGQFMTLRQYELPLFVVTDIGDTPNGPFSFSNRVLRGRRLRPGQQHQY